jgi:plasmid stability protein
MSTLQVRSVPEAVSRTLKSRAAEAGMSLSDFVLHELETIASQPTIQELTSKIRAAGPANLTVSPTQMLRRLRDGAA